MAYKPVIIAQDERKIRLQAVNDKIINKVDKTKTVLTIKYIEKTLLDILDLLNVK